MKKVSKFLVPLLLGLLILASIVWYLFVYDRPFTRDALLGQARFHDLHGNSKISSMFYDAAYNFSGHDDNVAIELANQYKGDGNYTKAEVTLTHAIASNPSVEGYTALCRTFVEQDKLLDAVRLLDNIREPAIKEQLDAARPKAPVSDYAAGYYSQYVNIHLSSGSSAIYYSTDGSYPSIASNVFQGSVSLPAGETVISAIAIDKNGLVSPVTTLNYTVTGVIEEVTFTDAVMEAAIREAINAGSERTLMTDALWEITEFTVPEGVTNYDDLALLPNLTKLTFQPQSVGSLSAITFLSKLEELDLTGCRFSADQLVHPAAVPSLKNLILADCGLSTIADLSGAVALYKLDLSNNTLRNLDVLSPMVTLKQLDLRHNAVIDLSALSTLTQLESLDISFNAVTNLAPLSGCTNLNWLDAGNNQIGYLSGVQDLKKLTYLDMESNQLSDISPLSAMTGLTDLDISSNSVSDISSLNTLTKLENFNFSSNQISHLPVWPEGSALLTIDGSYNQLTSLDLLKDMDSMTHVYMDYNLLTNIDALENCFCLVQVNVFGNEIKNVDKLRDHDIIVNYDPTYGMKDE